jgi:hypothetical protein
VTRIKKKKIGDDDKTKQTAWKEGNKKGINFTAATGRYNNIEKKNVKTRTRG